MFYIPSIQTIKEYNNLKTTKQPVKMTRQITEMDKFVYDKYSGLKNIVLLGSNIIIGELCRKNYLSASKNKNAVLASQLLGFSIYLSMTLLAVFCSKNRREKYFDDIKSKRRMYEKQGLNAVI